MCYPPNIHDSLLSGSDSHLNTEVVNLFVSREKGAATTHWITKVFSQLLGDLGSVLLPTWESSHVISHSCVCKGRKKNDDCPHCLPDYSQEKGGASCNSRALCLVKAQGPCLCIAPHHLFDSWGIQRWNDAVVLQWESFYAVAKEYETRSYREGQDIFILHCLPTKCKCSFTSLLKPGSELKHGELELAQFTRCPDCPPKGFWLPW